MFQFKVVSYLVQGVVLIAFPDNSIRSKQNPQLCVRIGTTQRILDEQAKANLGRPFRILNALDVPLGQSARSMDGLM
jgi:hypothetical protein